MNISKRVNDVKYISLDKLKRSFQNQDDAEEYLKKIGFRLIKQSIKLYRRNSLLARIVGCKDVEGQLFYSEFIVMYWEKR